MLCDQEPERHPGCGLWSLTAICMVTSERVVNGVAVSDIRYYIGSADRTAEE